MGQIKSDGTITRSCAECGALDQRGRCRCGAEEICRTCGDLYRAAGDGYDGECPSCADKTAERLEARALIERRGTQAHLDLGPPPRVVELTFTETVSYTLALTLPADAPVDPDALGDWLRERPTDGTERWSRMVEEQQPEYGEQGPGYELHSRELDDHCELTNEEEERE